MTNKPESPLETGAFTLKDEKGTVHECEILFSFTADEGEVIAYTDGTTDEAGDLRVFASLLGEPLKNGDANLLPIENSETWDMVDETLAELF